MTIPQFKSWLRSQGKTIDQWATENGFEPATVYRTLNGVYKGHRGTAHDVLVAAGVKTVEPAPANTERRTTPERRAA